MLKLDEVSVSFGGVRAVHDVSIEVDSGEIRGVIGPNGAGKSTLLNVINGFNRPARGRVLFDGVDLLRRRPYQIAECGIARTFQAPHLFRGMTVLENVMAGFHRHTVGAAWSAILGLPRVRSSEYQAAEEALEALQFVRLDGLADRLAADLSYPQQRLVEIARALVARPRLLLLDEPAAGLSGPSVSELDTLLRRVRDERRVTIILVEHVMGLVMGICDLITVLNYGVKIGEGPPEAIRRDPAVIEAYLGQEGKSARA